jgi:hypothetical protein
MTAPIVSVLPNALSFFGTGGARMLSGWNTFIGNPLRKGSQSSQPSKDPNFIESTAATLLLREFPSPSSVCNFQLRPASLWRSNG